MSVKDIFEDIVRNDLEVRAADGTYERMQRIVLAAHESAERTNRPAFARRLHMDRPVVKLAIAAVIIAAVVFGLFEFLNSGGSSGVVWAEVARRVEGSPGFISRMRQTQVIEGMDSPMEFYTMTYNSLHGSRMETFQGGELTVVVHADYESGNLVSLLHNLKRYTRQTLPPNETPQHEDGMNPRSIVTDFFAGEYRELGRRTIEGVEAEGIEVTKIPNAASNFEVDREVAQLWVSVETGYPVLLEATIVGNGGKVKIDMVIDQFQWNVEFDPDEFRVEIPSDYEPLEVLPGGGVRGTFDGGQ